MNDDQTIGEVYRLLKGMDERFSKSFDDLWTQAKQTNGRVTGHAVSIGVLKWAMALFGSVAVLAIGAYLSRL